MENILENPYFFQDLSEYLTLQKTLLLLSLSKDKWLSRDYWDIIWKRIGFPSSLPMLTVMLKSEYGKKKLMCKYCNNFIVTLDIDHNKDSIWSQIKEHRNRCNSVSYVYDYCNDCFQTICIKCSLRELARCKCCTMEIFFCRDCLSKEPGSNMCCVCSIVIDKTYEIRKSIINYHKDN